MRYPTWTPLLIGQNVRSEACRLWGVRGNGRRALGDITEGFRRRCGTVSGQKRGSFGRVNGGRWWGKEGKEQSWEMSGRDAFIWQARVTFGERRRLQSPRNPD